MLKKGLENMTTKGTMELPPLPDLEASMDDLVAAMSKAEQLSYRVSEARDLLEIEEESEVGHRVRAFLTDVDAYLELVQILVNTRIAALGVRP
jgi:hypothetical protein